MQIGVITSELDLEPSAALDFIQTLGIEWVEIHLLNRVPVETNPIDALVRLGEDLDAHGLRVCSLASTVFLQCRLYDCEEPIAWPGAYPSIVGNYGDHLACLQKALIAAEILRAPCVRIFGFWREKPTSAEVVEAVVQRLEQPLKLAEAAGIPLALETCPHTYFDWGERTAGLLERIASPWLRLLWDPAGSRRAGEPDPVRAYERLRPFLIHVHAKDLRFDPSSDKPYRYLPLGMGELDWSRITARLLEEGYTGVISLEPHCRGRDGTRAGAVAESARFLMDFAENHNRKDFVV